MAIKRNLTRAKMKNIARLAVMSWIKVVTHPLGIAGFALALVFGVVSRVMAQKRNKNTQWIVPAAYALAALCVVGGLALAYRHESETSMATKIAQPPPSMSIDSIRQEAKDGIAVAGVQGDVTVNKPPSEQKDSKPKQ